jgi:para-aminobenzoate synthetase component 1
MSGKIHALVVELYSTDPDDIELLFSLLTDAEQSSYPQSDFTVSTGSSVKNFESSFTRDEYENSILDIIDYIKKGDIYQVNMSQRFSIDFRGDSYALFTELFRENPAPFFAYLNCGDHQIVSTSPERFLLQDGNRVEARPIKGTRPRGETTEEDEKLRRELQASPKDDAELSMIVDLLRNDIGKVCKGGSVKDLVSTIEGYLEEDKDSIDLLKAAFPGGSVTGCPKIRAMEIIDEKEPYRRHIYTGSIGYIGFNNRMDLSIVIRTATITKGKLLFSVGGGIVYDSDPEDEYDETLHKAQSLMKILNRHVSKENQSLAAEFRNHFCWSNGKFINEETAVVPAMSKGYQYGKGVFETLKVENGQIEYLEEHLERLKKGCRKVLGKEIQELDWSGISELLIHRNGLNATTAVLKIIISEGNSGLFGNQNITVTCRKYQKRESIIEKGGFDLGIYPHKRESFLADYKTINYLFYLKAGEWAKENGFDEAVIINADGSVSETNTGNLLIVQDQTLIVPESTHRLMGIMEGKVIKDYEQQGYIILRKKIMPDDLFDTKTILVTNSLIGAVKGTV